MATIPIDLLKIDDVELEGAGTLTMGDEHFDVIEMPYTKRIREHIHYPLIVRVIDRLRQTLGLPVPKRRKWRTKTVKAVEHRSVLLPYLKSWELSFTTYAYRYDGLLGACQKISARAQGQWYEGDAFLISRTTNTIRKDFPEFELGFSGTGALTEVAA